MELRRHRSFPSELVNNLERLTIAQQILTMALAKTVEFTVNWSYGNSYDIINNTSGALYSTGNSAVGLSRNQRYKRNKKLKRLQQREVQISAPKTYSVSKTNKGAPIKGSTAESKNNVSKSTKETSNVKTKSVASSMPSNVKTVPSTMPISASKNEEKLSRDNLSLEKVPGLSDMLNQLATEFHTEIRDMQKVFDADLKDDSQVVLEQQPKVAEITFTNGCQITSEAIQFIRSVILNAINKLQKSENPNTPVFYCMTNKSTYVNILCQDDYAYKFLEDCFERTSTLSVHLLKPSSDRLYCCSAIHMGIIKDVKQFLLQIHLHVPKMHTEHWIVASNKLVHDAGKNETQFLFLVDELSALMLEHQYGNRLLINLSEVFFHNHGQLPNFIYV